MSSRVPLDLQPIQEENRHSFDDIFPEGSRAPRSSEFINSASGVSGVPETFESDHVQKFAGIGLEITSTVIGNLISHPCIVLRRQCQVNRKSLRYHLSPFTLFPVIVRLHKRQGLKCLWKGSSGIFILTGCSVALETFIAELTPFPREVSANSSLKHLAQHALLKFITFGILTPFYCSSLVETVQSDIASEKPGVLDILKEGICRIFKWGTPQSSRLLPMWQLIFPAACHGLSIYVLSSLVQSVLRWLISIKKRNLREKIPYGHQIDDSYAANYLENLSTIHFGAVVSSVIFYPAETILHRLYLQGTRTIIDNLDSGTSVLPVISKYEGFTDCFHTIVAEEGAAGLYKGFGALIFEYTLQALLLKLAKVTLHEIESLIRPANKKPSV
ncbi:mitochondrial outer membrane protein SLC25A46-like [Uloborus diversus]|uniref:mitochondrial outer membrane protein SLC25A46-like n=1 Tax=Uloborus diversus TaxID=327109 RepID=UPI0024099A00|nr:mitochondrial outer membrane protein SLC25A46-like [Uloborus diversus]